MIPPPQVQSQNVPSPKFKVMAGGTGLRIEVPDVSGMTQVDLHFRQDRGYFVQDFFARCLYKERRPTAVSVSLTYFFPSYQPNLSRTLKGRCHEILLQSFCINRFPLNPWPPHSLHSYSINNAVLVLQYREDSLCYEKGIIRTTVRCVQHQQAGDGRVCRWLQHWDQVGLKIYP